MPYMRLISQVRKIWENVIIVNSNISFFYLQIFDVFSVTHGQSIFAAKGKKIDLPWVVRKKWRIHRLFVTAAHEPGCIDLKCLDSQPNYNYFYIITGCGPWKSSSFSVPSYSGKQIVFMDGGIPQTATAFVFRTHQVECITYNRSVQTPNPFVCTAKWQSVGVASPFFPAALQEHHQRAGLSELYFETGTMSCWSWRREVVASHTLWSSLIRISPTQSLGC